MKKLIAIMLFGLIISSCTSNRLGILDDSRGSEVTIEGVPKKIKAGESVWTILYKEYPYPRVYVGKDFENEEDTSNFTRAVIIK